MYHTTLISTGGSDASFNAVDDAIEITAPDGTVHVLGILEELPMYNRSATQRNVDDTDDDADRRTRLEASVERIEDAVVTAGIDCVTAIEEGVPSHEIVEYADETGVDAIVMGKRSMSDAAGDLLGSTTERVLQNATTTVVSVPASK